MAVQAGSPWCGLTEVGSLQCNRMVMAVPAEVGRVTDSAFAAWGLARSAANQGTVQGTMTRLTARVVMDLANTHKGSRGSHMTIGAINHCRCGSRIHLDIAAMIVTMTIKVCRMASLTVDAAHTFLTGGAADK